MGIMVLKKLFPVLAFSVLLLGTTGYAIAHGNVDQSSSITENARTNIIIDEILGQSFTPTVDNLVAVELLIFHQTAVSVEPLTVRIRDGEGVGGTELGITQTHTGLPGVGNTGFVHFDFPGTISLTPGNRYTITIVLNDNNDFGDIEMPRDTTNPYPGGIRIFVPGEDLGIVTLFEESVPVGGTPIPIDTTSLLLAGTQMTASWMIPVIVSVIGIGIVIARKF